MSTSQSVGLYIMLKNPCTVSQPRYEFCRAQYGVLGVGTTPNVRLSTAAANEMWALTNTIFTPHYAQCMVNKSNTSSTHVAPCGHHLLAACGQQPGCHPQDCLRPLPAHHSRDCTAAAAGEQWLHHPACCLRKRTARMSSYPNLAHCCRHECKCDISDGSEA